ncbi:MAG: carboxypeptidase-like regulatory domain-containing protein, partial [Solirubrobacteraceae bacterium]
MKTRLLAVVALVAPATLASFVVDTAPIADAAATGGVEGTVIDAQSSQIIPGGKIAVSVACGSVRRGGAVDGAGHFAIDGLPEGACTLTASGTAYVATRVGVAVTAGSIATVLVSVTTRAYMDSLREQYNVSRGNLGAGPPGVRKHRRPMPARAGAGAMAPEPMMDEDRGAARDMRAERAQLAPPMPAPPPP